MQLKNILGLLQDCGGISMELIKWLIEVQVLTKLLKKSMEDTMDCQKDKDTTDLPRTLSFE